MFSANGKQGVLYAISAAVLFGLSTPLAKPLVGEIHPITLAGLLYAGSGIGLAGVLAVRRVARSAAMSVAWPRAAEWRPLIGAIFLGGVVAPTLLMFGLQGTAASVAALLLNLESVFTAMLAWFVFRENFDRRIALGMVLIVCGGIVLSWSPGTTTAVSVNALLIAAACLCWAADNNLTRMASASDAIGLACIKGLAAGSINLLLSWHLNLTLPSDRMLLLTAATVGFLGYGVSLALFVLALRHLGAARTGAYFSVAPFVGAAAALVLQSESLTTQLIAAGVLMAAGVWLHLTEQHVHMHSHEPLKHSHAHTHDEHHRHDHEFPWDGEEPHTHQHRHTALIHRHPHFPDIHHWHEH